jgi:hypothetical protein
VKEIEQEAYGEHGMSTQEDSKQTAAVDLSKRLEDLRKGNDGSSQRGYLINISLFYLMHILGNARTRQK